MPTRSFWAYHLSHREIIDTYLDASGIQGHFTNTEAKVVHHARRAIFQYLMPGDVRVWYGGLNDVDGMIFIIGKSNIKTLESIPKRLLRRCHEMFLRDPEHFTRIRDPGNDGGMTGWLERDGKTYTLECLYFMESNRIPGDYICRERKASHVKR